MNDEQALRVMKKMDSKQIFKSTIGPVVVALTLSFVALIIAVSVLTVSLNMRIEEQKQGVVEAIIDNQQRFLEATVLDVAVWDAAIENIFVRADAAWIESNISETVNDRGDVDGIWFLDFEGNIIYRYHLFDPEELQVISTAVQSDLLAIFEDNKKRPAGSIFGHINQDIYIIAWHEFYSEDKALMGAAFGNDVGRPLFLEVSKISREELELEGEQFKIVDLRLGDSSEASAPNLILDGINGPANFYWAEARLGTEVLITIIPILLAALLIALFCFSRSRNRMLTVINKMADWESNVFKQNEILGQKALEGISAPNQADFFDQLLGQAQDILAVHNSSIWLAAAGQNYLVCSNAQGNHSLTDVDGIRFDPAHYPNLSAAMIAGRHLFWNNDDEAAEALGCPQKYLMKDTDAPAGLVAPIIVGGTWEGTVLFKRASGASSWSQHDIMTAVSVATVASLVLTVKKLMRTSEDAVRSSQAKSAFLANMSHELRTPLNAIIGFSEVIKTEVYGKIENASYEEYISLIYNEGRHLLEIINEILDLSKVEANKFELCESTGSIHSIISEALRTVAEPAHDKGITIEAPSSEDFEIYADLRLIKQCILNLVSNAINHSGCRHILVSAAIKPTVDGGESEEKYISIMVRDDGSGLSEKEIQVALLPFSQVADHMTKSAGGTGLGLPLVKSFVELHGGSLIMESEIEQGLTAEIRLPASRIINSLSDNDEAVI